MAGDNRVAVFVDGSRQHGHYVHQVEIARRPLRFGHGERLQADFEARAIVLEFAFDPLGGAAQGVGNLRDGSQHALGQPIQLIFIGVDWRLSAARIDVAS